MKPAKLVIFAMTAALSLALSFGQQARLQVNSIEKLSAKAAEVIDVTLDEPLLQLARKFLSTKRSADEARAKEIIAGLKGVYVKQFQFDKEGEYSEADIEPIRAQLRLPGWSRIVGVRSKQAENIEVFVMSEGNVIKGISVLATEPKELTIVNVIGPIDIEKLSELEGQFGIPKLGIENTEKGKR
jgi:uncharacterized protein DUF4252